MANNEERIKDLDRLTNALVVALENIVRIMDDAGKISRTGKLEKMPDILDELSNSCFAAAVTSKNASVIIKEELEL